MFSRATTPRVQAACFVPYCSRQVVTAICALWFVAGCSDTDSVTVLNSNSADNGGSGRAGSGSANADPVYVVFSTIFSPESNASYYATTSSIDGELSVDITTGIELPGYASIYSPPQGEYLLSGSEEAPTLTRYDLDSDGRLVKGVTLSMANFGVSETRSQVIFASPTKAYFLDLDQTQLVSFNPESMEVVGAIPIGGLECVDGPPEFGFPIEREDGFWFTRSCSDNELTVSGSSLVHLNPETDEVTVTHDPRCMGMKVGFMANSGDAYWFSDPQPAMVRSLLEADIPRDCAMRLPAGETAFDPSWYLDLSSRSGGVAVVASVPAGDSKIWVKSFVASAVTESIPVDQIDWGVLAWRWGLLDVESDVMIEPDNDADLIGYFGTALLIDGRSYIPASNDTFTETTLLELTTQGFRERLHVQGELRMIVKLR